MLEQRLRVLTTKDRHRRVKRSKQLFTLSNVVKKLDQETRDRL